MTPEQLLELNPSDIPMNECDFYLWLQVNGNEEGHYIENIRNYYVEKGVITPINLIELRENLKFIHERFYGLKFEAIRIEQQKARGCTDPYARLCNCPICREHRQKLTENTLVK